MSHLIEAGLGAELLDRYSLRLRTESMTDTLPFCEMFELGSGTLALSIQESSNGISRVKSSKTTIATPIGEISVMGGLSNSSKDERLKKRVDKVGTGDLHQTTMLYKPKKYLAILGSSFDFNSPISKNLTHKRFRDHNKSQWLEIKSAFNLKTPSLYDLDIIGQEWMAQFTHKSNSERWLEEVDQKIVNALTIDKQLGIPPEGSIILPNTQKLLSHLNQLTWTEHGDHLGKLHRTLAKLPGNRPPDYFLYNANCIFINSSIIIPLFDPPQTYTEPFFGLRTALEQSLQSNADMMLLRTSSDTLLSSDTFKYDQITPSLGTDYDLTHVDHNFRVDQYITKLRDQGWSPEKVEQALIEKAKHLYLTPDTQQITWPFFTSKHSARSTLSPPDPITTINHLSFTHHTDGVTNDTAKQDRDTPLRMKLHKASKAEESVRSGVFDNEFGETDDASTLIVEFQPNDAFNKRVPPLKKLY